MSQPTGSGTEAAGISDEQVYEHLKAYQEAGMIGFVLPTEPLGDQWIIGHGTQILKFTSKEGIVGFLAGISVCAQFARNLKAAESAPIWDHPAWGAKSRQEEAERAGSVIPVRVPADAKPVLASERRFAAHRGHPIDIHPCPVCGLPLGDRVTVLILAGIEPSDRKPDGWTTGAAIMVHAACAGVPEEEPEAPGDR